MVALGSRTWQIRSVILIAQVRLIPSDDQANHLGSTIARANEACGWLSDRAWETQTFGRRPLHKISYQDARDKFPDLSSQMIVGCTGKVAAAYKIDRDTKRQFRPSGATVYDARVLSWKDDTVNIWTVN